MRTPIEEKSIPSSSDSVCIRPAQESDLETIRSIYNYYVLNSTATFDTNEQTAEQRRKWWEDHRSSGLPVVVAESDGAVVGWGSLSYYHARCAYRQTVEPSIYVDYQHLGKGLGRMLIESLLTAAKEANFHCIVALICSDNAISLKLVQDCGFEPVGTLKEVGCKFDRWLDVAIAQKIL